MIQYDLEMAEQDLANKKQQKEELITGVRQSVFKTVHQYMRISICVVLHLDIIWIYLCVQTVRVFSLKGMTSKLFGQESQEQRESRLAALEQSIQEGEATLKEKNTECQ